MRHNDNILCSYPLPRLSADSRGVKRKGVNVVLEEEGSKEETKHRAKSNHAVDHTDAKGRSIPGGKKKRVIYYKSACD